MDPLLNSVKTKEAGWVEVAMEGMAMMMKIATTTFRMVAKMLMWLWGEGGGRRRGRKEDVECCCEARVKIGERPREETFAKKRS